MHSTPKIRQPKAVELKALHPEGIFSCQIVGFGDMRMANNGSTYFMSVSLKTAEGDLFAHLSGIPSTLYAIRAATPFYATRLWTVKVKHRMNPDNVVRCVADILWERGGTDV
ncbi:hypothetical protein EVB51_076 [Rhizobium phage RHph_Y17]|uniref:Uncharacterized protein n=2 Tax=Kleczkowskavirus RHEph4 TaxID=1921526 RepID=A0A7S5QX00_9CAUD|nr:hypothetical protein EVB51_076 [Rhizobium phage RHph_Y17]QIG69012.1 hypothetical protein EVB73_076 [Rhizobium phage RHph_Y3_43]QIG69561.1 hypothetical protein EVB80_078 [Rhizobium phage RHph_I36]QIG75435.1 hypothetical protein EVC17_078 [Rhizobium phage RHph_Y1_1]QIG75985.1 hypothetical protein EVC21_078 [Rhizobium phage RHph_Y2_17_2]